MGKAKGVKPNLKRYRSKPGTDLKQIKELPNIIKLMMYRDAIWSSYRGYRRLEEDDSAEAATDRLYMICSGCGWAFESIKFITELFNNKHITKNTIRAIEPVRPNDPIDPREVWREYIEENASSPLVTRLKEIRHQSFAHFDLRPARKIIADLQDDRVENVFAEWTEKKNSKLHYTVAMMAITRHVFAIFGDGDDPDPSELGNQIMSIGILLDHLIPAMITESGLALEPCPPREK